MCGPAPRPRSLDDHPLRAPRLPPVRASVPPYPLTPGRQCAIFCITTFTPSAARAYIATGSAIGKWDSKLDPHARTIRRCLEDVKRNAPFDLIRFPADSVDRFIDENGVIRVSRRDLEVVRFE